MGSVHLPQEAEQCGAPPGGVGPPLGRVAVAAASTFGAGVLCSPGPGQEQQMEAGAEGLPSPEENLTSRRRADSVESFRAGPELWVT